MEELPDEVPIPIAMKILWLAGFCLSAMCLLLQISIFIRVPCSRKVDLKILTQITIARLANVALEYAVVTESLSGWGLIIGIAMYMHSDCVLICWMFVFSKNLYDKVIQVFTTKKITFVWTSIFIWLLTLPVGIVSSSMLYFEQWELFGIFYRTYMIIKFVILTVNLMFFGRILYIAIKRKIGGNGKGILRTCVISFILVTISSVQVFLTDLVSYFESIYVLLVLNVLNSYQILAVTYIFLNLVRGFTEQSGQAIFRSQRNNSA